ncbi:integral membrane protein 2C-like [Haliotis rufescens]|uniref:integral membrane protein 2C-like n=1 Tax=Haliotis rufescens TaxID=6454 RepID=UPI001EAFA15E|nr:integral membrane protein 2C-like [Haliotis rufescens]
MTIYKTLQSDKKDEKSPEEAAVVMEPLTGEREDVVTPKVVRVTYGPHQTRTYVNLCLIIAALIVLGAGIIGAIFLYRHLSHRVITARCGVTYYDEIYHQQADFLRGRDPVSIDLTREDYDVGFKFDFFEENVEVSEADSYERLQVPKFDECDETDVWHDFQQNYTAIVDHVRASCYVMKLNRSLIAPPRDVIDLINKLGREGYYLPRADVVREKYTVVTPPMGDLKVLGPYIMRECFWYNTFRLEKIVDGVVKRSTRRRTVPREEVHHGFSAVPNKLLLKVSIRL